MSDSRAEHGLAEALQPRTYTSASGLVALHVAPSTREGAGAATYTLTRSGKIAWSAQRPITLWEAVVSDDGRVGGYAYTEGYNRDAGSFVVAKFAPNGTLDVLSETPREVSPYLHTMADPKAAGIFLDADRDRFVVRILDSDVNAGAEAWWPYHLSTGEMLGRVTLERDVPRNASMRIVDARAIRGRSLMLVQWAIWADGAKGVRFSLVDGDGNPVWSQDQPNVPGDEVLMRPAILDTTIPGEFAIHDAATSERVTYRVEAAARTVRVEELRREPYSAVNQASARGSLDAARNIELQLLGSFELDVQAKRGAGSVPRISDFAIDDRGRFGVLSAPDCESTESLKVSILEADGASSAEFTMPSLACSAHDAGIAWAGGDRWLVSYTVEGTKRATVVELDAVNGKQSVLSLLDSPPIEALAATRDGFVALVTLDEQYTMSTTLRAFDHEGRTRWVVEEGYGDESKLFSAEDVTVTTTGEIVVLENVPKRLKVFDAEGAHVSTLDLAKAWGREPNYPTDLEPDAAGRVIVGDFNGKHAVVHMGLDKRILAQFTPAHSDGRKFDMSGNVQIDASGGYWTSDGHSLMKLDTNGRVVETIGDAPPADALTEVAAIDITLDGIVHVVDSRTSSVHVFDRTGERMRICRPNPTDFDGEFDGTLTVSADGDVFVQQGRDEELGSYVRFDAGCKRVGAERVSVDEVAQDWISFPRRPKATVGRGADGSHSPPLRWLLGYENLYLIDAKNRVVRTIERTPDGEWVHSPEPAGVAPDGSIAVVINKEGTVSEPRLVAIYAADGEPIESWPVPDGLAYWMDRIAFDGRVVVLPLAPGGSDSPKELLGVSRDGSQAFLFRAKTGRAPAYAAFVGEAEDAELWVFDGTATIDRYAWPREWPARIAAD